MCWCSPAFAGEWSPIAGVTAGARLFSSTSFDLDDQFAYGARFGLSDGSRFSLFLDYLECKTRRQSTYASADIMALRALARFDVLRSELRPYLIAGLGGLMMQFHDAPNSAVGALTFGAGIEFNVGSRWALHGEGTWDWYTFEPVAYYPNGVAIQEGYRATESMAAISGGLTYRFE